MRGSSGCVTSKSVHTLRGGILDTRCVRLYGVPESHQTRMCATVSGIDEMENMVSARTGSIFIYQKFQIKTWILLRVLFTRLAIFERKQK